MSAPTPPDGSVREVLSAMAEESAGFRQAAGGAVADALAGWLAGQYVLAARRLAREAGDQGLDLRTLGALTRDLVALRQGDHSAARLAIDGERLELERQRTEERMQALFEEWLTRPEVREKILGKACGPAERDRRIREIFGVSHPGGGLSDETLAEIERAARML